MSSYLFTVSIGPVQEFIATARRSRDLWFGSWLLSELSKAAAKTIVACNSLDSLIFPAPASAVDLDAGTSLNVANKILAIVQGDPEPLARSVKGAIERRLHDIRDGAFLDMGRVNQGVATQQIDDLVEYFWAALPLDNPQSYRLVRRRLEGLMAARKVTRDFSAVPWGSEAPKSSLDGTRESVIPEELFPTRQDSRSTRDDRIKTLYDSYGAGSAERLSGVDLLKRRGHRGNEAHFPSTSHMASLPFLLRLDWAAPDVAEPWSQYLAHLRSLHVRPETIPPRYGAVGPGGFDGSVLYEGRLADALEGEKLRQAQNALRGFLSKAAGEARPLPYYALLLADGDGMGKAIDAQGDADRHRALSRELDGFAGEVKRIVEHRRYRGALVYAGGDDVLAFVPVHTALSCAQELAREFRDRLERFTYPDGEGGTAKPTLSVGVVISHHLEPLSDALALAREAEKTAQRVPRKNALAVTVSKRSGADGKGAMGDAGRAARVVLHVA